MQNFIKYLEAHLQGNPAIPGQRETKPGEEDYLSSATRKKKKELGINSQTLHDVIVELNSLINKSAPFIKGHELELEQLATKAIKNLYKGIIERYNVEFEIKLSNDRELSQLLGLNESANEIYKRKIINLVSQGEAVNTKHLLHSPEVKEGIEEIYGKEEAKEIFEIWDSITKAASKLDQIWDIQDRTEMIANSPKSGIAGAVDVKWIDKDKNVNESNDDDDFDLDLDNDDDENIENNKEDIFSFLNSGDTKGLDDFLEEKGISQDSISKKFKPMIVAMGKDFPMLLHEAVKGLYNVLAMGGIPEDKDVARLALKKGYARLEEPEEWKYGPSIAADIRDFINENESIDLYPNIREQVWKYMVDKKKIPTDEFLFLIRGILSKTQEARIKVDAIIKIVVSVIKKFYDNKTAQEKYKADMEEYRRKKEKYDKEIEKYKADMEEWNKTHATETESQPEKTSTEVDYGTMTPTELNNLLNNALGDGDYETAKEISKFIK